MTKPVHSVQPSRFGPARKGRLKPCLFCKADFYCPQCQDTGGSLPEKKYCSNKCANTDRYHNGKEVDRFWEKVDRSAGQEACWPWTGAVTTHRYGMDDKVARGRTPKTMTKRLNAEQVREIRAARGTLSSGEIAVKYGITQSYAFGIWSGRVWRNA